jgi:hypothetical protein
LPISDDATRVLANVTFPLLCVFVLSHRDFLASISREQVGLLALLWCLVPWVFVWAGKPLASAAYFDLASIYHRVLDTGHTPTKPWLPIW